MSNKPNRGFLMKNNRKESDTHPDLTGSIVLPDGTEHWLNGWHETSAKGKKYLSISIGKRKEPRTETVGTAPKDEPFDDEIPFAIVLPFLLGAPIAWEVLNAAKTVL